jgi:hypothetical protein
MGLTFTSIFPGPTTGNAGIGWTAESLAAGRNRQHLNSGAKLSDAPFVFGDRMSLIYAASFHIAEIERLGSAKADEYDSAGFERLRSARQRKSVLSERSNPRVWAVSIASATMGGWMATASQWAITRQITGGQMQFLENIEVLGMDSTRQKWSLHWSTHQKHQALMMLQQLIQFDPQFCTREAHLIKNS